MHTRCMTCQQSKSRSIRTIVVTLQLPGINLAVATIPLITRETPTNLTEISRNHEKCLDTHHKTHYSDRTTATCIHIISNNLSQFAGSTPNIRLIR